jgi:MarR family transcriptional regulator, organic hydroperoxide resistance regulator
MHIQPMNRPKPANPRLDSVPDETSSGDFDHQTYVPYLLRRITDTLIDRCTAGLKPHGITLTMWRVLAVLHRRGGTRFGTLGSQTLIEPPTLSRIVEDLRSAGLVTKASSEVDARGVLIVPTKKGIALVERLTPLALTIERETLTGLTEDEAELFRRLVKRVCTNLAPFASDSEGKD